MQVCLHLSHSSVFSFMSYMNRFYICIIIFFFQVFSAFAQWNSWNNAESVTQLMHRAQEEGLTYFSQYHLWNVRAEITQPSIYYEKTGVELYVYGLDFFYASGSYLADDYQSRRRYNIIELVKQQWRENKAIPCFSWHLENPYVTSGYDYMGCRFCASEPNYPVGHENVVREIVKGENGSRCGNGRYSGMENESWKNPRKWFFARCKEIASIINELKDDNGNPIPIIFRPWHECEGAWFWWGGSNTTAEDYKSLYKLTVNRIKKYTKKSQIIWAYSPDSRWETEESFMSRYPGDKYVDMIGYDDYQLGDPKKLEGEIAKARIVSKVAIKHNKIAALFEGANSIVETSDVYFKNYLMPLLSDNDVHFAIAQLWSTSLLTTNEQLSDRMWFLSQPKILKVKK